MYYFTHRIPLLCFEQAHSMQSAESENRITFDVTLHYFFLQSPGISTPFDCDGFYVVNTPPINTKIPLSSQLDIT